MFKNISALSVKKGVIVKSNIIKIATVVFVTFLFGFSALAEHHKEGGKNHGKKHHGKMKQKIQEAVKSGKISEKELAAIKKDRQKIQAMRKKAMADGEMTDKEKARIKKKRRALMKKTKRMMNN